VICCLLYREIGVASFVGIACSFTQTILLQTTLTKLSTILRLRIAKRTDQRLGIMNEIIKGIQVIKMYAWEKPFEKVVAEIRRSEVKQLSYVSYIRAIFVSFKQFSYRLVLFITIVACVSMKKVITADIVFSMAAFFHIFQVNDNN